MCILFYNQLWVGWEDGGGGSLQSRCQEPQKHFARCGRLYAVSGSWCAHTGTLAWVSFLEVFSRSVEIYTTVSRTHYR